MPANQTPAPRRARLASAANIAGTAQASPHSLFSGRLLNQFVLGAQHQQDVATVFPQLAFLPPSYSFPSR
eukprot:284402-Chlamydomonas_euryale.AAC.1